MANSIRNLLERSQKSWVLLGQATAWIAGVLAGFLLPPPSGTVEEGQVWVRFAQFIVTVVIGAVLLAALRWKSARQMFGWAAAALLFLALGSAAFFSYQVLAARWTTAYDQQRVVIGEVYTDLGREYQKQNPHLTPADLVMHFAGKTEKIWVRESLTQRRLLLAATYVLAMPLFTVSLMSILQAIHCAASRPAKRRAHAEPIRRASA